MNHTEQEILSMEGRELDEAVAVHVMGWKCWPYTNTGERFWFNEDDAPEFKEGEWKPSTNIAQAYEALETVKEIGVLVEIEIGYADIRVDINGNEFHEAAHAASDKLPIAICRALLLWKLRRQG